MSMFKINCLVLNLCSWKYCLLLSGIELDFLFYVVLNKILLIVVMVENL